MKKIISIMLAALMLSTCLTSISAVAMSVTTRFESNKIENKLDGDPFDEIEFTSKTENRSFLTTQSELEPLSIEAAALELKNQMLSKTNVINVSVFVSSTDQINTELTESIFKLATSEELAESSSEGDYLGRSWQTFQTGGSYGTYNGGYKVNLTYTIEYRLNQEQETAVNAHIADAIATLGINEMSDYAKVRAIHDYVCDSIKYDYVNLNNPSYNLKQTAYAGLINGTSVCEGYALSFYKMAKEVNLSARFISGGNHAWNSVKVNNKYYYVDCTWDDTGYDNPDAIDGDYWKNSQVIYDYFLKGKNDFLGHTFDAEYWCADYFSKYPTADTELTCTHEETRLEMAQGVLCTDGGTQNTVCTNCGEILSSATVAPKAHSLSKKVFAPTCTKQGYTALSCASCGYKEIDEGTYTQTVEHSFTDYVFNNDATCVEDGTQTAYCDYGCGQANTIAATNTKRGHDYDSTDCFFESNVRYHTLVCQSCGDSLTEACTLTKESSVAPTCTTDGEDSYYCAICEYRHKTITRAPGHIGKLVDSAPATCTKNGYAKYKCQNCSETHTEVIEATGHSYKEEVIRYNRCDKADVEVRTCTKCGLKQTMPLTAVKSHTYNSGKLTKKPTSTSTGTITYTCTECGAKKTSSVAKLAKASISSLTAKSKGFTVKWNKVSSATGYQIQYSTSSSFSSPKTVTITKNSTLSKSITKLKAKKKYYVRIRTYKTIKGVKCYSAWSAKKHVTTKK